MTEVGNSVPFALYNTNTGLVNLVGDTITARRIVTEQLQAVDTEIEVDSIAIDGELKLFEPTLTNFNSLKANPALAADLTLSLPTADGVANSALITDGGGNLSFGATAVGDVSAPSGNFSDDNRLIKSDSVAPSKNVQQSGVILTDSNDMSGLNALSVDGSGQILLRTSSISANAIKIDATAGGFDLDAALDMELNAGEIHITSTDSTQNAIKLECSGVASGINLINTTGTGPSAIKLEAKTGDIDMNCQSIDILANTTTSGAVISISTVGNIADTLVLSALTSTSSQSIKLDSLAGGILLQASNASVDSIKISAVNASGGVFISSGASAVVNVETVTFKAGSIDEVHNIRIQGDDGLDAEYTTIRAASTTLDFSIVLPTDGQSVDQFIKTTSSGAQANLTFADIPFPSMYVHGCDVDWKSATAVTVNSGDCRDDLDSFNLSLSSNTDAVITVTGAGGLQTLSSEASDTWYEVHVIGDTSGVNATDTLLIPVGTSFLESGFDVNRKVGYVRNNSASNFRQFSNYGLGSDRHIVNEVEEAEISIRDGAGSTTFVPQSVANFVPPLTKRIDLQVEFDMDDDAHKFFIRSGLNAFGTVANTPARHGQGISSAAFEFDDFMISNVSISPTTPSFEWATSDAGNDVEIRALGYYIEI